jgi:hypothetical protein
MTNKILNGLFGLVTAFVQILGSVFPIANTLVVAGYTLARKDEAIEDIKAFIIGLIIGEVVQLILKPLKP